LFGEVADGYIWETTPQNSYDNDTLYTGVIGSGERRSLIRFGLDFLPDGVVVRSALFGLWETGTGSGETITLYRVTAAWSEGQATWDNLADRYDSSVAWGRFTASGPGVLVADVTGLVAAWASGSVPNYGLMLRNTSGQALDRYASSESSRFYKPGLLVCDGQIVHFQSEQGQVNEAVGHGLECSRDAARDRGHFDADAL
jgi:hypothetical protein